MNNRSGNLVRRLDALDPSGRVYVAADLGNVTAQRLAGRLNVEYPHVEVRIEPEGIGDTVFLLAARPDPPPNSCLIRAGENFHFEIWDPGEEPAYTVLSQCRVAVEGYNVCNATCGMCPVRNMRRKPQVMPLDLSERILRQAAAHAEIQVVNFYLHGEPLLDPYLESRIRAAAACGMPYLRISTNGELLTPGRFVALREAGLDEITVSLDAPSAGLHEQLRPGVHFGKIAAQVRELVRIKRANRWHRPAIMLGMIVGETNRHCVESMIATAAEWFDLPVPADAPRRGIVILDDRRGLGLFLSDRFDWTGNYADRPTSAIQRGPCPGYRDLVVYSSGEAAFCCLDVDGDHVLGDLNRATFDEVFLSEYRLRRIHALVERAPEETHPRCKRCWLLYTTR